MGGKMDPVKLMRRHLERCEECGDCLLWMGPVTEEGQPRVDGEPLRRRVWKMREGPIPKGMMVRVSCGRANCIEHLVLVTRGESMRQNMSRPDVRARITARSRERQRAVTAKLSMDKVREIRAIPAGAMTQYEIAERFNIAQSLVSRVRSHQAWVEPSAKPFAGLMR